MAVGRVADQEDPADGEAVRHDSVDRPARDLVDRHRVLADAQRRAGIALDLLVGGRAGVVDGVVEVDHPLLRVRPPALRAHRHHHNAHPRLRRDHPADEHVLVLRERGEVRGHVQRGGLRHDAQPLVRDADQARDRPAAVGADQVAAADLVLGARLAVADPGGDAVVVLVEVEQLAAEVDAPGGKPLRALLEDRLEPDLRQVELPPGAGGAPMLVGAAGAPALQPRDAPPVVGGRSGQPGVVRGRRHVLRRGAALGDLLRDSAVLEDLHRPLVEDVRLRQRRRGRQRADQQVINPQSREEHRRGQARASPAHHQDVDVARQLWLGHGAGP